MNVLPTCVSGYHVRAYIPQRPEEGIGSCVTITGCCEPPSGFWECSLGSVSKRHSYHQEGFSEVLGALYQEYGGNDQIFYFATLYKVNKLCFIIFKFFWCIQFCCILKEKTIHCIACIWLVEIPENNFRETFNCVH